MKGKKIFKAVATVTIISMITRLIAFVFKIYLSRTLGAEIIGIYQITLSIFIFFVALTSSGIPVAMSRHIAAMKGDNAPTFGITTSALLVSTALSIIAIAVLYACPSLVGGLFADKRCVDMFYILLPALLSTSIYAIIRGYYWGKKNYLLYTGMELFEEVLSIIIVVSTILFGVYRDDMSSGLAIAYLISDYVGLAVLIVLFFVTGGRLSRPRHMRELLRSAVPMTSTRLLGSLMSSLMALLLPMLLVRSGVSTSVATANYGRASGMVMPLVFVPSTIISALTVVIIPELASLDKNNISYAVHGALRFTAIVVGIFVAIYIALGDSICTILYNDEIAGKYMLASIAIIPPMAVNQMTVSILNTLGKEKHTFVYHLIGSIVLAIIILITPKWIGIYGYFVAITTFHMLTGMMYLRTLSRIVTLEKKVILSSAVLILFSIVLGAIARMLPLHANNEMIYVAIIGTTIVILYMLFITKCGYIDISLIKKLPKKSHKK